jgi:inner membrane protein involved in colicin E2 resistance
LFDGAPSFSLFGAFFPAWILCACAGILVAIGVRAIFVGTGWCRILPFQLFVCSAAGIMFGVLAWLVVFW